MNVTEAKKALAKALKARAAKTKKTKTKKAAKTKTKTKKPKTVKARKPTVARLALEEKLALQRYEKAHAARRAHLKVERDRLAREFAAAGAPWVSLEGHKNNNNQVTVYEPSTDSGSDSGSGSDSD